MICPKCGQEYEGDKCPRCNGPEVIVNNADYLKRKRAYEEKQAGKGSASSDKETSENNTADVKNGNILTGTKAPVILTSRSDEFEVKVNSIALAAVVAEAM